MASPGAGGSASGRVNLLTRRSVLAPSGVTSSTVDSRAATAPAEDLRTLYVYLCNGGVEAVRLCKSMKLSDSEMIVRLGDGSARRFRRADVYLASWGRVTPPVMF
jgi:hypothetical protein